MKSILDANLSKGQKVLVRGDLDVPIEGRVVSDTYRLDLMLPTLNFILEKKAFPVICGHIGRPQGQYKEELSTKHLSTYFDEKLGISRYELLQNLRFNPGEENNSPGFAKELSQKADVYVNESFANSHREHASIVGITKLLPSYSGMRLTEEVKNLGGVFRNTKKPLVILIGGAKLETKKPVISKFLTLADTVLVGGRIGLDWDEEIPENLLLPMDYEKDQKDIGPKTVTLFSKIISEAGTIVWAGPMGMFEVSEFESGTKLVGQAISESKAYCIAGGGDTIAALHKFNLFDKVDFVSSGGGAMLEFLTKGNLPGLEALDYHG